MITYSIYNSVNELPNSWDRLACCNVFFQKPYLFALQEASPKNISWHYIGIYNNQELVGFAIVQHVALYLKDMLRFTKVSCFKTFLKNLISRLIKGHILVVGNLMHTGQHGLYRDEKKISETTFFQTLFLAINQLKQDIKVIKNQKINALLMKDYFEEDPINNSNYLLSKNFHKLSVQPNMLLNIKPEWLKMEDYLLALNKKYKRRHRRARKKLKGITSVELSLEEIKSYSKALYKYYKNISNNAKINTFILPENHFYSLKKQLKDRFRVFGYFLNNELVGFYTLLINNNALETYFLGYNEKHQYQNQLYLNMLYDMLQFGIENKLKTIVYARTAMAIKSSVGAEAKPMTLYLKHTNSFLNSVLKPIFKFLKPSQDWQERHPFLPQ